MASFIPNVTDIFPEPAQYRPDFSYIDTMLKRRTAMYERGFQELAGKYKFISRDVTNPTNALTRDKFINEAMVNLKDLSAMDLSQQQNVESAGKVFEPFVKNTDLLGDMALTGHWNQQEAIGESYRLKDGGKEFSQDNINYVRMQKAAFAQDDAANWKSYYANKRYYNPYYDYNKEFKEWFASYKPDVIELDKKSGLYKISERQSGATPEDLKLFFSSVASEKAKQQMRIESTVRLADSPENLASVYANIAKKDMAALDKKVEYLKTTASLEKDPTKKQQIDQQIKNYVDQKEELALEVNKISNGDIDFIRANADKLAFSIYFDQKVGDLAKGLSWKEYKRTFSADEVALDQWKDAQDWARTRYKEDREDRRKKWELEGLPVDPNNANVTLAAGEQDLMMQETLQSTDNALTTMQDQKLAISNALSKHLAKMIPGGKTPDQITEADITAYSKSVRGQQDVDFAKLNASLHNLGTKINLYTEQKKQAMTFAEGKVDKAKVDEAKSKFLDDYKRSIAGITPEEIFQAVKNGNYTGETRYQDPTNMVGEYTQITSINGKKVNYKIGSDEAVRLSNAVKNADYHLGAVKKEYQSALNNYFADASTKNKQAVPLPQGSKPFKQRAAQIAGLAGINDASISQILLPGNNDAFFYVDNEDARKSPETYFKNIETKLKAQGLEARYDAEKGLVYVKEKPGFSRVNFNFDMLQGFGPNERELITFGKTVAGDGFRTNFFWPGGRTHDQFGNRIPGMAYEVDVTDAERKYYLYVENEETPIVSKSSLVDLFIKADAISSAFYQNGVKQ